MTFVLTVILLIFLIVYSALGLPKSIFGLNAFIIFISFYLLTLFCSKVPLPDFSTLTKEKGFQKILSPSETDKTGNYKYNYRIHSGVSVAKKGKIYLIPDIVLEEINLDVRKLQSFDLNSTLYIEKKIYKDEDQKRLSGIVWGIDDSKNNNPIQKLKITHNQFVSGYYLNYLILIPIIVSFFYKRKAFFLKNALTMLLLVFAEILRLYYFSY